mmetsp:Transcript_8037/g.18801  ORF Transcript_8037/g.18801 Transcript_8037/m.18801 type:complete len:416 (+) Transcript_8037:525-1772(+)
MADDGSEKKPKTATEDGVVDPSERGARRPDPLWLYFLSCASAADMRGENQRLRSENEQLHGRTWQLNHEVLPVVVIHATVVVDLSRVDTSIVAHIASFLGESLELLNLALTCKSFGWRQPASSLNLSLVEGVACRAVCSRATKAEMGSLPTYTSGTTTWMSILNRYEHLLDFDVFLGFAQRFLKHMNGVRTAVCTIGSDEWGDDDVDDFDYGDYCTAVSSGYVMTSGVHCVEFNTTALPCCIGIVRPMPNLDAGAYEDSCFFIGEEAFNSDFLAQRSDDWGDGNVHPCEYSSRSGKTNWTAWDEENEGEGVANWEGMESGSAGDTIGMLLNLDNGTLTVYKNNRRLGVPKDGLSGPYCWYAAVGGNVAVAIQKGSIPALNDNQVKGVICPFVTTTRPNPSRNMRQCFPSRNQNSS